MTSGQRPNVPQAHMLINIDVDDMSRALAFYTRAFGLTVGRKFDAEFVELLGGAVPLYLLVKQSGSNATPRNGERRSYHRHWTPVHIDWVVDDLPPAIQRAQEAGAVLESGISEHEYGSLALLADPFGHGFCLLQFKGRGYDELLPHRP